MELFGENESGNNYFDGISSCHDDDVDDRYLMTVFIVEHLNDSDDDGDDDLFDDKDYE